MYHINQKTKINDAIIATIYRNGNIIIPTADTKLKESDILLVAVKTKDLSKVLGIIEGKWISFFVILDIFYLFLQFLE